LKVVVVVVVDADTTHLTKLAFRSYADEECHCIQHAVGTAVNSSTHRQSSDIKINCSRCMFEEPCVYVFE